MSSTALTLVGFLLIGFFLLMALIIGGVVVLVLKNRRQHAPQRIAPSGVVRHTAVAPDIAPRAEPKVRPTHCPECGVVLPADSPDGLCPECLLRCGLSNAEGEPASHQGASTSGYSGPFSPPSPTELAAHFPHLEILGLL